MVKHPIGLLLHGCRIFSKSRRTSKSRHPRNLAAPIRRVVPINATLEISPHGKGSSESKYVECRRTRAIHTIESRCEAGEWTSRRPRNLAALEISPQAGCSDLKLNLTAVRFRGNTVCTIQGIILTVVWWNDTINDMFNVAASIHDQNLMYITLFKTQVRKWIRITHTG